MNISQLQAKAERLEKEL